MNGIIEKIISGLEALGCKARIVSVSHLNELKDELFQLRDTVLDKEFYKDALSWMDFAPDKILKNAKSILVVAAPQIITKANFKFNDKTYSLTIPPTYVARDIRAKVKELLDELCRVNNFSYQGAQLPLKQVAVKSGLAKYGRNNITYVDGMGSFHLLLGYYMDLDLSKDSWQVSEMASDCKSCSICIRNCPTGSISSDQFLIRAEKCITYLNEYEYDFPQWMKPEWHNSLIGCMSCQFKCPKNAAFVNESKVFAEFTEEETQMLLNKVAFQSLPEATKRKLDDISMTENYSFISRNISILLRDEFLMNKTL